MTACSPIIKSSAKDASIGLMAHGTQARSSTVSGMVMELFQPLMERQFMWDTGRKDCVTGKELLTTRQGVDIFNTREIIDIIKINKKLSIY